MLHVTGLEARRAAARVERAEPTRMRAAELSEAFPTEIAAAAKLKKRWSAVARSGGEKLD